MTIPDGVYSVFSKAQAMGGKTHFMETWVTTQTCAAYPGRVLKTFHCRHPDIRRTHTGAWVRQGRRYSTYALAMRCSLSGEECKALGVEEEDVVMVRFFRSKTNAGERLQVHDVLGRYIGVIAHEEKL